MLTKISRPIGTILNEKQIKTARQLGKELPVSIALRKRQPVTKPAIRVWSRGGEPIVYWEGRALAVMPDGKLFLCIENGAAQEVIVLPKVLKHIAQMHGVGA